MASMACVVLAMFLGALSQTVVATTMPLIIADLGGFDRYAWAATSYVVAATVAYPIVGRLSDHPWPPPVPVVGTGGFLRQLDPSGLQRVDDPGGGFARLAGRRRRRRHDPVATCRSADLFRPKDRGRFHGVPERRIRRVVRGRAGDRRYSRRCPVMAVGIPDYRSCRHSGICADGAGVPESRSPSRAPRSRPDGYDRARARGAAPPGGRCLQGAYNTNGALPSSSACCCSHWR